MSEDKSDDRSMGRFLASTEAWSDIASAYYEQFPRANRAIVEKLYTGWLYQALLFRVAFVSFKFLLNERSADRFSPMLDRTSRWELTGSPLSENGLKTFRALSWSLFDARTARLIAHMGFIRPDGAVNINLMDVRIKAATSWSCILLIVGTFGWLIVNYWIGFRLEGSWLFLSLQSAIFIFFTAVCATMSAVFIAGIFVRGVVPLAVAKRVTERQRDLTYSGIIIQVD